MPYHDRPGLYLLRRLGALPKIKIYWGEDPARLHEAGLVFFPFLKNVMNCGLAGIVAFAKGKGDGGLIDLVALADLVRSVCANDYDTCRSKKVDFKDRYLGGDQGVRELLATTRKIKREQTFYHLYSDSKM